MSKKLLVIGYVWPEPNTTAAGCRMQQLLEAFISFGFQVTFASTASKTEYSLDLQQMGIRETPIQLNHSSFDEFVKELSPDMVLFDRFMVEEQFGWRVADCAPNAIRILNTEDLHSLRKAREEAHKKKECFTLQHWKNHPITLREVASIYRCDLSLIISTYEMEILYATLNIPTELLCHLPFMVGKTTEQWPSYIARKGFVSIGNGKHAPNVDAIKVLKQEIWPQIRKQLPEAEMHIYGAYLPQQLNEMHSPKTRFHVHGWAEDVDVVLKKAKVLLAPIQFGAGIKGKLLDAMKIGTPSVTTSIGAEGMHGDLPWNGTITNAWDKFAQAAVDLYQNPTAWENAQRQGSELLQTFYDKESLQTRLKERLQQLSEALQTHRTQNFIGKLLQHQTMASTKYMAKWIEAKHKE
ncbi:putative glycosyltransferase [Allomuricauda ruestringensis DSM 13258]|uniref:Glycosyltransferase n=1 Tax=Allomuricauda ruestringensis (strain DSM 13258 / CIP 107369 / LMG 19739 / B1) TaxID=886377 RepID=G2PLA5_ALLRU|nr:glycosyltransferase [Allomuricauda ruestringensis]AEM72162.1 putative glycosyltransferase [Allomuricauda ruestringensis DSM 13258]